MSLNCPRCASTPLDHAVGLHGLPLDRCPSCRGFWFDRGELDRVPGGPKVVVVLAESFALPVPTSRRCPHCSKNLKQARVGPKKLLIDGCPDCGGFWVDEAELTGIFELSR